MLTHEDLQFNNPRVVVTDCNSVVKYTLSDLRPSGDGEPPYKRLYITDENGETHIDPLHYACKDTGEIKEFTFSETKGDNMQSVIKTFARLRDLVNANFDAPDLTLFVTLTYDPKRLVRFNSELTLKKVSKDMRNFFAAVRASSLPEFRSIYVVEQQGNGNWHTHLMLFFDEVPPFIPQETLETWWKHGFVRVSKRFNDGDIANVGAYVCACLTDHVNGKARVKNARLKNYPTNAHLYRCSQNVRRPKKYDIPYKVFEHTVPADINCTYNKTNDVHLPDNSDHIFQYLHYPRLYGTLDCIQDIGCNDCPIYEIVLGNNEVVYYVK